MSKKYYYLDPSEQSAKWHMYGVAKQSVIAAASKLAVEIGQPVVVGYENISRVGTVRETGDAAICHASGKTHVTKEGK